MIADKIIAAAIKVLAKQFNLDKLSQVYKYVFEKNELDEANVGILKSIKNGDGKIKQIFSLIQGYEKRINSLENTISSLKGGEEKKWYDK
tara:strand:+ start:2661 stop:2930 length:270 start_codon:yes stop_codon:yes gene_type:complete